MSGQEREWLVIGGSGGIGKEIVLHAARQGALVRYTGGRRAKVVGLQREWKESADLVQGMPQGWVKRLGGMGSLKRLDRWIGTLPLPDVLVCSYGPLYEGRLESTSPAIWHRMALHNLVLPGMLLSRLLPPMYARGTGTVVLFGGTDGELIQGYRRIAAYAAAKAGVAVATRSSAAALKEYAAGAPDRVTDVRTICICPDFVDTEYVTADQRCRYSRLAGDGGFSRPESYAQLVWRIAQREEIFQNGAILNMRTYRK